MRDSLNPILAGICTIVAMAPLASQAQEREFAIPAGNLKAALDLFIQQSGMQLLYRTEEVASERTEGASGRMTPELALGRLLEGTSLQTYPDPSGAAAIVRPRKVASSAPVERHTADATAAPAYEAVPEEIVVTARRREESLDEVPIAIDVLTPVDLRSRVRHGFRAGLEVAVVSGRHAGSHQCSCFLPALRRQVQQATLENGNFVVLNRHAAAARLWGFELDSSIEIVPSFSVGLDVSHLSFEYREFGANVSVAQLEATRLSNRPRWKYGVNAQYALPIPATVGELTVRANWHWQSESQINFSDGGGSGSSEDFPSYGLLNMFANWERIGGSACDLSVFGSNLTNKVYPISGGVLLNSFGFTFMQYGEPRMYGVRVRYRFGS